MNISFCFFLKLNLMNCFSSLFYSQLMKIRFLNPILPSFFLSQKDFLSFAPLTFGICSLTWYWSLSFDFRPQLAIVFWFFLSFIFFQTFIIATACTASIFVSKFRMINADFLIWCPSLERYPHYLWKVVGHLWSMSSLKVFGLKIGPLG